ncbi:MotA/TolQ/ExbB proton channel family protein [bacterium]|nr:MotA/TolQ/ExbB proton channel family protein [bacterium]
MGQLIQFIVRAGIVSKIVLLMLILLSLISWTIIYQKLRLLKRIRIESAEFCHLFRMQTPWADLFRQSREMIGSPYARIFRKGYSRWHHWQNRDQAKETVFTIGETDTDNPLDLILNMQVSEEINFLNTKLIFLATTVSVSPFLGLLGTVWGIMSAFLNMGIQGTTDIVAVGPGIAEALITTIAGLAVAIPAVVAYNYLVDKMLTIESEMHNFTAEFKLQARQETAK